MGQVAAAVAGPLLDAEDMDKQGVGPIIRAGKQGKCQDRERQSTARHECGGSAEQPRRAREPVPWPSAARCAAGGRVRSRGKLASCPGLLHLLRGGRKRASFRSKRPVGFNDSPSGVFLRFSCFRCHYSDLFRVHAQSQTRSCVSGTTPRPHAQH